MKLVAQKIGITFSVLVFCFLVNSTIEAQQAEHSLRVSATEGADFDLKYLMYFPPDYDAKGEAKPFMLFLHGRGECGTDLSAVKQWGPPKIVEEQEKDSDNPFPFIMVAPQCPTPGWDVKALKDLVDHCVAEHNVDSTRIYVTGLSMGGRGVWKFASVYPHIVAAAIPICGDGDPRLAETLVNVPVWAFHGDEDLVVDLIGAKNLVAAIEDQGGKMVKFSVYEGVGHNSWSQTYDNPEIYEWLLKHTREPIETEKSDDQ